MEESIQSDDATDRVGGREFSTIVELASAIGLEILGLDSLNVAKFGMVIRVGGNASSLFISMFMEKRVRTYAISKVKRDSVSLVASSRIRPRAVA
jgi:hypothetical protein